MVVSAGKISDPVWTPTQHSLSSCVNTPISHIGPCHATVQTLSRQLMGRRVSPEGSSGFWHHNIWSGPCGSSVGGVEPLFSLWLCHIQGSCTHESPKAWPRIHAFSTLCTFEPLFLKNKVLNITIINWHASEIGVCPLSLSKWVENSQSADFFRWKWGSHV